MDEKIYSDSLGTIFQGNCYNEKYGIINVYDDEINEINGYITKKRVYQHRTGIYTFKDRTFIFTLKQAYDLGLGYCCDSNGMDLKTFRADHFRQEWFLYYIPKTAFEKVYELVFKFIL